MADIGLPQIDIVFKGLGVSAIKRGQKGTAVLIVADDTNKTFTNKTYRTVADFTADEQALFSADNLLYIKDALEGTPKELIIVRQDTDGALTDTLAIVKGLAPRNCWIAMADGSSTEYADIATFVKGENANNYKRYKTIAYNLTAPDDKHVLNLTNANVAFADARDTQVGSKAIPYLLGYYAGLSLDMSGIAYPLKFKSVVEPTDVNASINNGELVLINDEGSVRIARSVNSLVTTGQNVTDDMKFVLIVEVMDLIFSDIYDTWKKNYKGKYKNNLDNQMLLVGAINSYFKALEDDLLDGNFDNAATINVEAQRLVNVPKYGEDAVASWDDNTALAMTYSTFVYLDASIKILNTMEDIKLDIYM